MELAFNNTGLLGDYDYADINHKKYDKKSSYRFLGIIGIIILIIVGINVLSCIGGGIAAACNSCSNCGSSSSSSGCSSCEKTTKEQYTIITNVGKTYTITKYKYSSCSNSYTDYSDDARLSSEYYTLEGYYKDEAMTKAIDKSDMKDGNTYYAKYSEKGLNDLYTIIFDCDYTMPQVDNVEVRVGENVNIYIDVEAFKAYDSTFKGFADPNGNIIIDSYGYLSKEYQEFHLYNWTFANTSYRTVHLTPKFQARYTIKFDMSGTGLGQLPSITIKDGESIKLNFTSADVKRKGYAFQGFYDYNGNKIINSDLSIDYSYRTFYASNFSYDSNNNITLYPRYEEITYNLTINYEYEYYSYNTSYSFKEGDSLKKVVDSFVKEYFDNSEYYLDYVCLSGYYPQYAITEATLKETLAETVSNVYLEIGKYSYINCVLIPGQEAQSIKYKKNSSVAASLPEPPEMAGWEFMGWFKDQYLNDQVYFVEQIDGYTTLYASWEYVGVPGVTNTIEYLYQDGSPAQSKDTYTPKLKDVTINVTVYSSRFPGYKFVGWNLYQVTHTGGVVETLLHNDKDNTDVFTYLPAGLTGEIKAVVALKGESITAIAVEAKDVDGNSIGMLSKTQTFNMEYGKSYNFAIPTLKTSADNEKYDFVGWKFNNTMISNQDGKSLDKTGQPGVLTYESFGFNNYNSFAQNKDGMTVEAIYKIKTYTVSIKVKTQVVDVIENVPYGTAVIFDESKAGSVLDAWEQISGYHTLKDSTRKDLADIKIYENLTLIADIKNKSITVRFTNTDGLDLVFNPEQMTIEYDTNNNQLPIPTYIANAVGYDFAGYYYNGSKVAKEDGIFIGSFNAATLGTDYNTMAQNGVELVARSEIKRLTVSFSIGNSLTQKTYNYGNFIPASDHINPTPDDGYEFDNWYKNNEATPYDFDNSPVTSEFTLTAKFQAKNYDVTLTGQDGDLHDAITNSIDTKNYSLTYGESFSLNKPSYNDPVYEFEGYRLKGALVTDANGASKGVFTVNALRQAGINVTITDLEAGLEFVASYKKKIYSVTIIVNDYETTIHKEHGDTLLATDLDSYVASYKPSGNYYFNGWYLNRTYPDLYGFGEVTSNLTIRAVFSDTFAIEFYDGENVVDYKSNIYMTTTSIGVNGLWKDANGKWIVADNQIVNINYNYLYNCHGVIRVYKYYKDSD